MLPARLACRGAGRRSTVTVTRFLDRLTRLPRRVAVTEPAGAARQVTPALTAAFRRRDVRGGYDRDRRSDDRDAGGVLHPGDSTAFCYSDG
jgi:hypothetical protein